MGKRNTIPDQSLRSLPCALLHVLAIALNIQLWAPQPYWPVILETFALSSGKIPYVVAQVNTDSTQFLARR